MTDGYITASGPAGILTAAAFGMFQESLSQALKLIGITLVEHKQNQIGAWFTIEIVVSIFSDKSCLVFTYSGN